ncbi:MAG: choice-of-anchor tandem repeat GloVer-containing protein [Chthoniobacteraceae bacterium]
MKVPPSRSPVLVVAACVFQLFTVAAFPQTFEVLHSWSDIGSTPNEGVVRGSDGNFYGTIPSGTKREPASGIFRLEPSGRVTILRTFSLWRSLDGYQTKAGLVVGPDGAFYGINSMGGANHAGTAFRITVNGQYSKVADFESLAGANPEVTMTDGQDGFLYGVTGPDQKGNRGSIFRVSPSGGVEIVLQFPYGIPSKAVSATRLTLGPDGALYGIGVGTTSIIRITFPRPDRGPRWKLLWQHAGRRRFNKGTIYRITPDGSMTILHSFDGRDGLAPRSPLAKADDGLLFALEPSDSKSASRPLYRMAFDGTLTHIGSFDNADGMAPSNGLVIGRDGNFYGTTPFPPSVEGTAFRLTPDGRRSILHRFSAADGKSPSGPLAIGLDGNFYGMASSGGAQNRGTLFRLSLDGEFVKLHDFSDRAHIPTGGLVIGNDGNFYGTTAYGGDIGGGTFFQMTPGGEVTILYSFSASESGSQPRGTLVKDPDGNFFGTTVYGGADGFGTIFRITSPGVFTLLHSFHRGNEGAHPYSGVLRRDDGMLFGATYLGGGRDDIGTIYRLAPDGTLTVLVHISDLGGSGPWAVPVLGPDGKLYATTTDILSNGFGRVFSISDTGTTEVLHVFDRFDGAAPLAPLHFSPDGKLFGLTSTDGPGGGGTFFRLVLSQPPVALADVFHLSTTNIIDVIANDSDPENDFRVTSVQNGSHGTTELLADGRIAYRRDSTFDVFDEFTYVITDGFGLTASAKVTVLNDAPVAVDDAVELSDLDSPQPISVLQNDFDPDGPSLAIVAVSQPPFGTVSFTANTVSYRPFRRKAGLDSFTYTVRDFFGAMATATVRVQNVGAPSAGRYFGFIGDTGAPHERTGFLRVVLTRSGEFTGRVSWQGDSYRVGGTLVPGQSATITIRQKSGDPLALELSLDAEAGNIVGTLTDGALVASVEAAPRRFGIHDPSPLAGNYTAFISSGLGAPPAAGFAAIKVTRRGEVRTVGRLPDGSSLSGRSALREGGRFPFYRGYPGHSIPGSVFGEGTVAESGAVSAQWTWIRPSEIDTETALTIEGARYTPPTPPALIIPFEDTTPNAEVELSGGGFQATERFLATVSRDHRLTIFGPNPNSITARFHPSNGSFRGSFANPHTGKAKSFRGLVREDLGIALGVFRSEKNYWKYLDYADRAGPIGIREKVGVWGGAAEHSFDSERPPSVEFPG